MLNGVKTYTDIIDVKKLREDVDEWMKIREVKIRDEYENKIENYKNDIKYLIQLEKTDKKYIENEMLVAMDILLGFSYHVSHDERAELMRRIDKTDSHLFKIISSRINEIPYIGEVRANTLLAVMKAQHHSSSKGTIEKNKNQES